MIEVKREMKRTPVIARVLSGVIAGLLSVAVQAGSLNPPPPSVSPPPPDPNPTPDEVMALCRANPATCGITVSDVLQDVQYSETEPNDHLLSADPIASEVPIFGQLLSAYDSDWFRLETDAGNTIVSVNLEGSGASWIVSVHDQAGLVIASWLVPESGTLSAGTGLAQAGGHYVSVQSAGGDAFSDGMYKLSIVILNSTGAPYQPKYNFTDVETEFNNLFTTADSLGSNVWLQGQFMTGRDIDIYRIDSAGDEVLRIELCPPGSQCFREDPRDSSWALFLLDGEFVNDGMLSQVKTTYRHDDDVGCSPAAVSGGLCEEGDTVPGSVSLTSTNAYYLNAMGVFDTALMGIIDPTWGNRTSVVTGLEQGKTYFVMVLPILRRTDSGDVVHQEVKAGAPDKLELFLFPFSDDQYTMRVTRTQMSPSSVTGFGDALQKLRSTYSTSSMQLDIPEVTVGDTVYSAKMRWNPVDEVFKLESVIPVETPATQN